MLFSPLEIRGVLLPNRIVMPPMVTGMGVTTEHARAHYVRRGRGGAGLVIVEPVDAARFNDLAFFRAVSALAGAIGETGAAVGIQIALRARARSGEKLAPSPEADAREAQPGDLAYLADLLAHACLAASKAGFEVIQVQGGGGFFLHRFFSPAHNRRRDAYGGDLAGRSRLAVELAAAARSALPDSRALAWRLTPVEEGAYGLEDSLYLARRLAEAGVDLIDLYPARSNDSSPPGELARAFKEALPVPVVAAGGMQDPAAARAALERSWCDLVAVGRGLLADPDWPRKVREGREAEIIPCLTCGIGCTGRVAGGRPLRCVRWGDLA